MRDDLTIYENMVQIAISTHTRIRENPQPVRVKLAYPTWLKLHGELGTKIEYVGGDIKLDFGPVTILVGVK